MQPSREREGKSVGEGAGGTGGMQPSRKREGKPVGEGEGRTLLGGFFLLARRLPGLTILYRQG
ncbi:MAG: hypothetical protein KatS3mg005_3278 [Bryobacteraceae bacterium]|nr:MAG: hypothetical protein KatS3mg005_3278 [Bryobacteraceae bacterium]